MPTTLLLLGIFDKEVSEALMRLFSLLVLIWRRIRRSRKVYHLADKQVKELFGNREVKHPTASTYLSFNRPLPPSFLLRGSRERNSILDRCHLYPSSTSPAESEYWEVDDSTASGESGCLNTAAHNTTVILKRFNATSNLQYISRTAKNDSMIIRIIKVLKTTVNTPRKRKTRPSLFIPVCSSTPLRTSPDFLFSSPKRSDGAAVFHRTLDKHVPIPNFPPPPPPVEFNDDTLVAFDNEDIKLWEIEKSRMCLDSMCTVLPINDDSIVLNEDGVDLNETFIDEVTFYVDRPPSAASESVLRVYSKTDPSQFYEIYLSKSVEV